MKILDIIKWQSIIKSAYERYENIYIFGAGKFSDALVTWLKNCGLLPDGIFVTEPQGQYFNGICIRRFNSNNKYNGAIILAVSSKYHPEILDGIRRCFDEIVELPDEFFRFLSVLQTLEIRVGNDWIKCDDINSFYEITRKGKTIILQRILGMGDALVVEPICRKLKERGFQVGVLTEYKDIFYNSNYVDFLSSSTHICLDGSLYISLAYGYHPFNHILDAYIDNVKQFIPDFVISGEDRIPLYDKDLIRLHDLEGKNVCLNIEASGWKTRIYNQDRMKKFATYLTEFGYRIFEIGGDKKNYLGVGENCFDLSLRETVELMSKSDLYIGMDNGLMHIAQAIRLPVFVMFGSVCPLYRIHDWSRARVMWKNVDELSCAGCFHRRELPCGEPSCIHEECKCLDWSVEEVIYAFENLKYNNPPVLKDEMLTPLWQIDEE